MTIRYKEQWVSDDMQIVGTRSLRDVLIKRVKPSLVKLDPNEKDPKKDSVKIYPAATRDKYGDWVFRGKGRILIGPEINSDPICIKNHITWGLSKQDIVKRLEDMRREGASMLPARRSSQ